MFELLIEDLDHAAEILRQMQTMNESDKTMLLCENQIRIKDIEKTVDLCRLMCYYYERMNKEG